MVSRLMISVTGDGYKFTFTRSSGYTRNFLIGRDGQIPDIEKLFPKYEYFSLDSGLKNVDSFI